MQIKPEVDTFLEQSSSTNMCQNQNTFLYAWDKDFQLYSQIIVPSRVNHQIKLSHDTVPDEVRKTRISDSFVESSNVYYCKGADGCKLRVKGTSESIWSLGKK